MLAVFFLFFFYPPQLRLFIICTFPSSSWIFWYIFRLTNARKTPQACHSLVEGNDNRHFYSIVVWFDETRNKLNSTLSWRRRKIRRPLIPDEGDKLSKQKWFRSKESFLHIFPGKSRCFCSVMPHQHLMCLIARRRGHMTAPTENRTDRRSQALPPCSRNRKCCVLPAHHPCHLMGSL